MPRTPVRASARRRLLEGADELGHGVVTAVVVLALFARCRPLDAAINEGLEVCSTRLIVAGQVPHLVEGLP